MLLNSKTLKTSILIIFALMCVGVGPSFAQDDDLLKLKPGQPIIVNGDTIEYFEKEGRIVAEGNVSITYGDTKLTCDRIEVNTRTRKALCEGNVRIEQPEGVLAAERIRYDFARRVGRIIEAELDAFPWFGRAEETARVAENEFLLRNGYITTCDLDVPHYRIKAEEVRVFPDEKVIAKNVVFYIGKVPVLWFPYYYHPIIQTRAKVQFIPGRSSDWGNFLLSAWRFHIRGNTRVDALVDYRSKKGFAEGANLYYNTADLGMPGFGEGMFRSYFIHENDRGTYDPTPFRDEWLDKEHQEGVERLFRKRFQWKHRIDFVPGTVGILEFNKFSDEYVLKDYFYNEYEETDVIPPNYVSLVSSQPNYTASIQVNSQFHRFYTVTQKLPELKLDIPDQRLWETPFYYSAEASAIWFDKEYAFKRSPSEIVNRFDSFHKLSYATRLGPVDLVPYGTFRETAYSRTKWRGGQRVYRAAIGAGLDALSRFYRVFHVSTNAMGLDINKLRHIVTPGIKYFHMHQPTVDKNNLLQMDSIDALEKTNFATLSLENKLQTKRRGGKGLESVDLARFIVSADYFFCMQKGRLELDKNGPYRKHGRFKNLTFDLELMPYSWLFIDGEMEVTPKNQAVSTASIEASLRPSDSFRMDMGYRYEKKMPRPRNQLTFDLSCVLSPKWRVGLYERFDLQGMDIEEQQISVTRDLHCWEVELVYNVEGSRFFKDEFTIWLAFKIKAFPDLQLGLSRSFSKRPPGSLPPGSLPQ